MLLEHEVKLGQNSRINPEEKDEKPTNKDKIV
jgi:hypothetical protein